MPPPSPNRPSLTMPPGRLSSPDAPADSRIPPPLARKLSLWVRLGRIIGMMGNEQQLGSLAHEARYHLPHQVTVEGSSPRRGSSRMSSGGCLTRARAISTSRC